MTSRITDVLHVLLLFFSLDSLYLNYHQPRFSSQVKKQSRTTWQWRYWIIHVCLLGILIDPINRILASHEMHPFQICFKATSYWLLWIVFMMEHFHQQILVETRYQVLAIVLIAAGLIDFIYLLFILRCMHYESPFHMSIQACLSLSCSTILGLEVLWTLLCTPPELPPSTRYRISLLGALEQASLYSRLSISWLSRLVATGQQRTLEMSDMPELAQKDSTHEVALTYQHKIADSSSFYQLLRELHGREMIQFFLWSILNKGMGLLNPILIKHFLDWAANARSSSPEMHALQGQYLAASMILLSIISALSGAQYSLEWKRFDLRVRAGVMSVIYSTTIHGETKEHGIGRIINIISVDLDRLLSIPGSVFDLVLIPIEVGLILVILHQQVSSVFTIGVALLIVMFILQSFLGMQIQRTTKAMLFHRDERVNLSSEGISSLRSLKFLGWTRAFLDHIALARAREFRQLTKRKYLDAFCVFFWATTPVLIQTSVFVAAISVKGQDLTAAVAFTTVSLLNRLIYPMNYFPWILNGLLEAKVSADRIDAYLFSRPRENSERITQTSALSQFMNWRVCFDNVALSYANNNDHQDNAGQHPFQLSIPTLILESGQCYLVIGPTASGKSTFMQSLLPTTQGQRYPGLERQGSIYFSSPNQHQQTFSYVSSSPWILSNKSIRENIVLGVAFDRPKYHHVLYLCDLLVDLERLGSEGDATIMKERGQNFSGGQCQRIAFARALYHDQADCYLFDDCLNALDPVTLSLILRRCFDNEKGSWRTSKQVMVVFTTTTPTGFTSPRFQRLEFQSGCLVAQPAVSNIPPLSNLSNQEEEEKEDHEPVVHTQEEENPKAQKQEEQRAKGTIAYSIWWYYFQKMGFLLSVLLVMCILIMQMTRNGVDGWIAYYTNTPQHPVSSHDFVSGLVFLTLANAALAFIRSFVFAYGGLRATKQCYAKLMHRMFVVPEKGCSFDQHSRSVGEIMNRLSGDMYAIDETLPFVLNICLKDVCIVLGGFVVTLVVRPMLCLVLCPFLTLALCYLERQIRPISRDLKRLERVSTSPLLESFHNTLEGLSWIQHMKLQHVFVTEFQHLVHLRQKVSFASAHASTWFQIRLDALAVVMTAGVCLSAAVIHVPIHSDSESSHELSAGVLGLVLLVALPLVGQLNDALSSLVATEKQIISVERIVEYIGKVETLDNHENQEQPRISITRALETETTTRYTHLVMNDLSVRYPGSPKVVALSNVRCTLPIHRESRVGIVGRTGSGKSSLIGALFGLMDDTGPSTALVMMTEDHKSIPLSSDMIEQSFACIPQHPTFYSGTLRFNLNPFPSEQSQKQEENDVALWEILHKCQLDEVVKTVFNDGLDSILDMKSGSRDLPLSLGQQQLFGFARLLVKKMVIGNDDIQLVALDEATGGMDLDLQDEIMQLVVREFPNSLILIVSHRLDVILKYTRQVMVLDEGHLIEFDTPAHLLEQRQSHFRRLVQASSSGRA